MPTDQIPEKRESTLEAHILHYTSYGFEL